MTIIGQVEKKIAMFFFNFFYFTQKNFLGFLIENTILTLFFCQMIAELCPFITSCFWGPAHWSYCKDHKTASDFYNQITLNVFSWEIVLIKKLDIKETMTIIVIYQLLKLIINCYQKKNSWCFFSTLNLFALEISLIKKLKVEKTTLNWYFLRQINWVWKKNIYYFSFDNDLNQN